MSQQELEGEEGQVVEIEEEDEEQDDIYPPLEIQRQLTHNIIKKGLQTIGKISTGKNHAFVNLVCEKKKINNLFDILVDYIHLRQINFSNNWISDVSSLTTLKYITHLNLSNNQIRSLDVFNIPNTLTFLEELNLSSNQITSLTNIQTKNLLKLNLTSNEITTCENFSGHDNIQVLILKKNKLRTLKGVHHMRNLEELYAAENPIINFYDLKNLPHLKKLHLRKTEVKVIDYYAPQPKNPAAEENEEQEEGSPKQAEVQINQIPEDLTLDVPYLPLLNYLNLRESKLEDLKQVKVFQAFKALSTINILATELADNSEYSIKEELIMLMPQLKRINKEPVEEEETAEALNKLKERIEEQERLRIEEEERLKAEEEERIQRQLEEEQQRQQELKDAEGEAEN